MDPRDRALAERLLAGDSAAAHEAQRWVRLAAAPFRGRLGPEWEDAVQDALVELIDSLRGARYRGEGSLRGYVWRTAVRNCLDRLRRGRRWAFVELDDSRLPPRTASALAELLGAERRDRLAALLSRLPRACRELWREILDGRSYREMSERLGVAEGALRVRALRCRRRALELTLREEPGNAGQEPAP